MSRQAGPPSPGLEGPVYRLRVVTWEDQVLACLVPAAWVRRFAHGADLSAVLDCLLIGCVPLLCLWLRVFRPIPGPWHQLERLVYMCAVGIALHPPLFRIMTIYFLAVRFLLFDVAERHARDEALRRAARQEEHEARQRRGSGEQRG